MTHIAVNKLLLILDLANEPTVKILLQPKPIAKLAAFYCTARRKCTYK